MNKLLILLALLGTTAYGQSDSFSMTRFGISERLIEHYSSTPSATYTILGPLTRRDFNQETVSAATPEHGRILFTRSNNTLTIQTGVSSPSLYIMGDDIYSANYNRIFSQYSDYLYLPNPPAGIANAHGLMGNRILIGNTRFGLLKQ